MASTPAAMPVIELTPKEAQLKRLLLDVVKHVDESGTLSEPVILRWAGGWVRDKLLGQPSHDIDTAINVMTGEGFSEKIVELCEKPETREKHGVTDTDIGNLHKIAANPEKSKNLETTTIKLFGLDVDFVNLRKEVYNDESRNPQMEFGTAEEDATRRDATINALFYNLNTSQIEDFTEGQKDMAAKLIRTPLEPFQTFMDDPLRILRLIRFAARLEFKIDPTAEAVMGDPRVLEAFRIKIMRERVGIEVDKMLKGNHPVDALELIDKVGIYHYVFSDPNNVTGPKPELKNWPHAYRTLEDLRKKKTPGSLYDVLVRSEEASYFAWGLAALTPWEFVEQPLAPTKGKPPLPLSTIAAREGIKGTNKLCDVLTAAHKHREEITELKSGVCQGASYLSERDRFGMAIRKWDSKGGHWRVQVLAALLVDAVKTLPSSTGSEAYESFLLGWQKFIDHLQDMDLMEAPSLKRLIDGNQLAKALGVKPGKWMAQALEVCVAWQLRHPEATDPAGAVEEVRSKKEELGIPIA